MKIEEEHFKYQNHWYKGLEATTSLANLRNIKKGTLTDHMGRESMTEMWL